MGQKLQQKSYFEINKINHITKFFSFSLINDYKKPLSTTVNCVQCISKII